jgi:hypothetical protein
MEEQCEVVDVFGGIDKVVFAEVPSHPTLRREARILS